ncbi:MAG TPA: T9SS type A sorting domain-containing protein [Flavitalea sp.]|nr:T9SS type A sorting domain-containing protein [Flavitalea sp.]
MGKMLFFVCLFAPLLSISQQIHKHTYASNGERIGFLEYKPSDYNAKTSTKYPVIIFLHGIGERGNGTTELNRVKNISIPYYIDRGEPMRFYWNGKWETFLVLSPQCPMKYGMWPVSYIDAMIDYAEQNLNIDKKRIFLAGLSMGGGGAWKYASSSLAYADRLAAIATVCAPPTLVDACNIARSNLPLWAFHAADDKVVNVSSIHNAVNKINGCKPGTPAKKTVWPTGGHNVWDRAFDFKHAYQSPNVFEWFLSQGGQTAPPPNAKPVAKTNKTITLSKPATFQLNGSASHDADGYVAQYSWRKVSGPEGGSISNPKAAATNVTGIDKKGVYQYELKVTDNKGAWAVASVTVNVLASAQSSNTPKPANKPPIANAGPDRMITLPQNEVWVTGGASADKDHGDYISYIKWEKIEGPSTYHISNPHHANTKITGLKPGTYTFRLTVKDGKGVADRDIVKVIVNAPPVANAGPDRMISLPQNEVWVTGGASADKDYGDYISYIKWEKIHGPSSYRISNPHHANTKITGLKPGIYTFRLTVRDRNGVVDHDEVKVTVNAPPVANAGPDRMISLPQNEVWVTGGASADKDYGDYISYIKWEKIHGPSSYRISNPHHANTKITALKPGTYTFRITVKDRNGVPDHDEVKVTVNAPPVANAGPDRMISLPQNEVWVTGGASADKDQGDYISYIKWEKIHGPSSYYIANPHHANTKITALKPGTYTFRLTVKDGKGIADHDEVNVRVVDRYKTQASAVSSANAAMDPTAALNAGDTAHNLENEGAAIASVSAGAQAAMSVFPNPAHGDIHVRCNSLSPGRAMITVYDLTGKPVKNIFFEKDAQPFVKTLDISSLKSGVYGVNVQVNNILVSSAKFIKQ